MADPPPPDDPDPTLPGEHHWWEKQLGVKLRGSSRRSSQTGSSEPRADDVAKGEGRRRTGSPPPDEHRWWEMQLGRKLLRRLYTGDDSGR